MGTVTLNPTAGLRQIQVEALFHNSQYGIIESCPQYAGKTTAGYRWLVMTMAQRARQLGWWISPTYNQAKDVCRRISRYLPESKCKINWGELSATLTNGSRIEFRSGQKPDHLYGPSIHAAVIDEASDMVEAVWDAVYSRTIFTNGKIRVMGNKRGRGWFYIMCKEAQQNTSQFVYRRMSALDALEQGIMSQERYDEIQKRTAPIRFKELYLLEDVDSFNPFLGYQDCVNDEPSQLATLSYGLDPARYEDEYAVCGLDMNNHWTILEAWNHTPAETSARRVASLTPGGIPVLTDSTGAGDVHIELLWREGVSAQPYLFTVRSRQELMENLAIKIGERAVTYPSSVADQLATFEYKVTEAGRVAYRCADKLHDDKVMAVALALWANTQGAGGGISVF